MPVLSERPSQNPASEATNAAEWAALPEPRRPFRRLTFAVMAATTLFAAFIALGLRGELSFALSGGAPRDLGELTQRSLAELPANRWVRAEGTLSSQVVRYARPLEGDGFRLAPLESNPKLWVELRVPSDSDDTHFVQPGSFVGRLVPARSAGLRYGALSEAVSNAGQTLPPDAWLLLDGESPHGTRWVIGLMILLLGFIAFNVVGLLRLARPIRDG